MLPADLVARGQQMMTVCNACRYCEAYCPVFQAMEYRMTFAKGDLTYLANLCHNCGECLYACQYAPPHEFGIDVPRKLAEIRLASYEEYCWPQALGAAFRRQPIVTAAALVAGFAVLLLLARLTDPRPTPGDFYHVVPHRVMVGLFSAEALFVVAALAMAWKRGRAGFVDKGPYPLFRAVCQGLGDAATMRHLHGAGEDCTETEGSRGPWRRRFHHFTFYGFALCFASTSVAALYHVVLGWRAPYPFTSLPVVLGISGGIGLLVGPAGLIAMRTRRDPALTDPGQDGLDVAFSAVLLLTSATGLVLMALRDDRSMPALLVIHLASVFALFIGLPYGKFVHGIYRLAALIQFADETRGHA